MGSYKSQRNRFRLMTLHSWSSSTTFTRVSLKTLHLQQAKLLPITATLKIAGVAEILIKIPQSSLTFYAETASPVEISLKPTVGAPSPHFGAPADPLVPTTQRMRRKYCI
jgi:hypothetical protein